MKIAVVGAGLMGSGIAQTFAQAGFEVTNIDTFEAAAAKAAANVEALFAKKVRNLTDKGGSIMDAGSSSGTSAGRSSRGSKPPSCAMTLL